MTGDYRIRPATLADADVMVRHRVAMFTEMGVPLDAAVLEPAFRAWLEDVMPAGTYRAWLVEAGGEIAGGGGITILPWPPGPRYVGDRLAFVYNVYTEPAHRRRGLARLIMAAIDKRRAVFLQVLGRRHVGLDHELLDQAVRLEPLGDDDPRHIAVTVEQDLALG